MRVARRSRFHRILGFGPSLQSAFGCIADRQLFQSEIIRPSSRGLHGSQATRILRPRRRAGQLHQSRPGAGRGPARPLAPSAAAGSGAAPKPADPQRPGCDADRSRQAAHGTRARHPAPGRARTRGTGPRARRAGRARRHWPAAQPGQGDHGAADARLPGPAARGQPVHQRRPLGHHAGMAAHRPAGHRGALQRHANARYRDHSADGRRADAGAAAPARPGRGTAATARAGWPRWPRCRW